MASKQGKRRLTHAELDLRMREIRKALERGREIIARDHNRTREGRLTFDDGANAYAYDFGALEYVFLKIQRVVDTIP